ncbi:DUF3500 domain-containing protein [Chitinophaga lutea]
MKRWLPLIFLAAAHPAWSQTTPANAALRFVKTLDTAKQARAVFAFEDEERLNWHFVPRARKGLPLGEMTESQRKAAYDLLRASLSTQGYSKATAIVELEAILRGVEGRGPDDTYRDPGKYCFSVFGKPGQSGPWGWRLEGHHVSLNFSGISGELRGGTPAFFGANPAIVPNGPEKGKQILKEESALAFGLLASLDEEQLKTAVVAEKAPSDIITGNKRKAWLLDPPGIGFDQLHPQQQHQLQQLIAVYVDRYTQLMADILWKEIKSNERQLRFAWAGGRSWGTGHYYRIQGPTFVIEYDNTQNNGNHVHTTFRDLKNDFGEDMLAKHYAAGHRDSALQLANGWGGPICGPSRHQVKK